jgi:hypothetical protein
MPSLISVTDAVERQREDNGELRMWNGESFDLHIPHSTFTIPAYSSFGFFTS